MLLMIKMANRFLMRMITTAIYFTTRYFYFVKWRTKTATSLSVICGTLRRWNAYKLSK